MENNLVKNGFTVLNYDENLSDYLTSYDTSDFKDLHLKNTSWKCKIKKLNEGRLFDLLCKYEKIAFQWYETILNINLSHHYNSQESLSSIIYYDINSGYHGEHTDYGLFNIVLNNDSEDCMYYKDKNKEWKLFKSKNKMIIMNGDAIEKISNGKMKAITHKVVKPHGFERYIVTKICYPKNQKEELSKKQSNWLSL